MRKHFPIPASISPEAAEHLRLLDITEDDATYPALDDHDGWRAHLEDQERQLHDGMKGVLSFAPASSPREIAGIPCFEFAGESALPAEAGVVLDIHGGALVMGTGRNCRLLAGITAATTGRVTVSVDYRVPPEHPFPAALDDCMAVYRVLLREHGADRLIVYGSSAGGNLAASLMLKVKEEGLAMPAALVLLSPEADLTESGDSFHTNKGLDQLATLMAYNVLYAGGRDLRDPYLSPLFGDLTGLPPTFLLTGTRDLFLSNTVRMHRALRKNGVSAELHVFEAMPHSGFPGSPEQDECVSEIRSFLRRHLER